MLASDILAHEGRRLLQIGVALLLFTSFWGFFIPALASPPLARSVHTLSALQAMLLMVFGLVWPRLSLGGTGARFAFWLLLYSAFAILLAFMLASFWGAGSETMPIAAGSAHGDPAQEMAIRWIAYSSAPTGIIAFALVLWGLRNGGGS
jgi:hydroxylaminobenzene mutase